MIDPYLHSNNNSMHNSAFQNFMIAPGSMMGGPQGFMDPRDAGIMQSQYGGSTSGLGSSPYGYMYDNPIVSKFAMEAGIISRPMGTNYASTAMHQANVSSLVSGTLTSGAISTGVELGGMYAGGAYGASVGGALGSIFGAPGIAVGGGVGAVIGGIAGAVVGEGVASPMSDIMNKRTMEKMAVHQSLSGLSNSDSPFGGGFGFSKEASNSLYRNMEKISAEDSSFTTGELSMIMNEGISSGDITGSTVAELNKKLEKTKDTLKALSQITGNVKIGELSDIIRQMTTVGFDNGAVTEVTHGLSFAARRLGQNPDDYRGKTIQNAQNQDFMGGSSTVPTVVSSAFTSSFLSDSKMMDIFHSKDVLDASNRGWAEWADRAITDRNIKQANAVGITTEDQRSFFVNSYARQEYGKANSEDIERRMRTGIGRGQASADSFSVADEDTVKEFTIKGMKVYDKAMKDVGLAGVISEVTNNGFQNYAPGDATKLHDFEKQAMKKKSNRTGKYYFAELGGKTISKNRLDTASDIVTYAHIIGATEPLGQKDNAVLTHLRDSFKNGDIEKYERLEKRDRVAGMASDIRRDETFGAEIIKFRSGTRAWAGRGYDSITEGGINIQKQSYASKLMYGENAKLFDTPSKNKNLLRAELSEITERLEENTLYMPRVTNITLAKRRYEGNHAREVINRPGRYTGPEKALVDSSVVALGTSKENFSPNAILSMYASGDEKKTNSKKQATKGKLQIDQFTRGKITKDEFLKLAKADNEELDTGLQTLSKAIERGDAIDSIDRNTPSSVKAVTSIRTIDKHMQTSDHTALSKMAKGASKSIDAGYRFFKAIGTIAPVAAFPALAPFLAPVAVDILTEEPNGGLFDGVMGLASDDRIRKTKGKVDGYIDNTADNASAFVGAVRNAFGDTSKELADMLKPVDNSKRHKEEAISNLRFRERRDSTPVEDKKISGFFKEIGVDIDNIHPAKLFTVKDKLSKGGYSKELSKIPGLTQEETMGYLTDIEVDGRGKVDLKKANMNLDARTRLDADIESDRKLTEFLDLTGKNTDDMGSQEIYHFAKDISEGKHNELIGQAYGLEGEKLVEKSDQLSRYVSDIRKGKNVSKKEVDAYQEEKDRAYLNIDAINSSGTPDSILKNVFGIDKEKMTLAEANSFIKVADTGVMDQAIMSHVGGNITPEEAKELRITGLNTFRHNVPQAILGDSDDAPEMSKITPKLDKYKLREETRRNANTADAVEGYLALPEDRRAKVFAAAKSMANAESKLETEDPFERDLIMGAYTDETTRELKGGELGIALGIRDTTALGKTKGPIEFGDIAGDIASGGAQAVFEDIWSIKIDTDEKLQAAHAVHYGVTKKNKDSSIIGMSERDMRLTVTDKEGRLKTRAEVGDDIIDGAFLASFDRMFSKEAKGKKDAYVKSISGGDLDEDEISEKIKTYDKAAEKSKPIDRQAFMDTLDGIDMGNEQMELLGLAERGIGSVSTASQGGSRSVDSQVSILNGIKTVLDNIYIKMGGPSGIPDSMKDPGT